VHVQRWVNGLSGRGFDMKVVSLGGEEIPNIETVIFPRSGKRTYAIHMKKGIEAALAFKPDLIHAHYATGFAVWLKRAKFRPSVLSVWGADVIDFPTSWFRKQVIRNYLTWPTHVTATSQFLKKRTLGLAPGIEDRLTVIPFGVNVPATMEPPAEREKVRLCFIKALLPKYGPEVLIDAMAILVERGCNVELSMAGAGELIDQLQKQVAAHKITRQVDLVGFISQEKMPDFLRDHDIMVMPSVLDSESFGVAVLEAAAAGRPSVASRVGGVPEVIVDGETGLLVKPGSARALADAIEKLVYNAELRIKMGDAGFEFVKRHYTWDRSLDMMSELYERLIHEHQKQ
jgi:glycosyltransferase involved in cell wall biosynthesis